MAMAGRVCLGFSMAFRISLMSVGTVVPVLPGKMRNYFLPSGNAEYVSREELKQLKAGGATFERAFAFGKQIVKIEEEPSVAPVVEVEDTKPTTRSARQRSQPAVTAKVELMQVSLLHLCL